MSFCIYPTEIKEEFTLKLSSESKKPYNITLMSIGGKQQRPKRNKRKKIKKKIKKTPKAIKATTKLMQRWDWPHWAN